MNFESFLIAPMDIQTVRQCQGTVYEAEKSVKYPLIHISVLNYVHSWIPLINKHEVKVLVIGKLWHVRIVVLD